MEIGPERLRRPALPAAPAEVNLPSLPLAREVPGGSRVFFLRRGEETVDDRIVNFLHLYCATSQTEFAQSVVGTGRWTEKVAPQPGSDATRTSPP